MAKATKAKKKKRSGFVVLLAVAVVGYLAYLFALEFVRLDQLQQQTGQLQQQLEQLHRENEQLQNDLDYSQTDSFIERMAREIFGWVRSGDIKFADKDVQQ